MNQEMDTELDVAPGELYLFPEHSRTAVFELHSRDGADRLIFVSKSDRATLRLRANEFVRLRNKANGAIRIPAPERRESESFEYTDPATFSDPYASGLSLRERDRILSLKKSYRWALTVQFFTKKYDDAPEISRSDAGLDQFIAGHSQEANSLGLEPLISASTLRKATVERGSNGDRALHYFLPDKERRLGRFWDPFILCLKARLIDEYWHPKAPRLTDVQGDFRDRLRAKNIELERVGADPLTQPTDETLRLWINHEECYHRYKARYGARKAARRFQGQQRAIQATRPLEYVMLDHTLADAWAPVEDENGDFLLPERPWLVLAIDVFSRVILAAFLTFAFPSIYTVAMALKQVIRPKDFLDPAFLSFKNFADFYGKPSFIIVDRAWENTGTSFQTNCESVGINVIWAPVRTPEFKCYVEHTFHELNQLYWHRLPSGIPHKPHMMAQVRVDPRKNVDRDLKTMTDGLWHAIRKMAFRVNSGIGMAPARAWQDGFRTHRRHTIDDVSAFDGFLGKVRQCQLSTSGIKLANMRFHDPETTSGLLNDLLRFARKSLQRRAPMSSGTFQVHVTMGHTCEYIEVWNPLRRRNIRLPNTLQEYSFNLTWEEDRANRALAQKENLEFCSEDEMLEVSRALTATYKSQIAELPSREARKVARKYRPKAQLDPGRVVEEVWEEPSDTGMGSRSIQQVIPASLRSDERTIPKISRRGGADASRKAVKARRQHQEKSKRVQMKTEPSANTAESTTTGSGGAYSGWEPVGDSSARLARLAAALEDPSC